jgi:predicted nucleic acid-binding protein
VTRVCLDASVLLAAAGSPGGGSSAALMFIAATDDFQAVVSAEILRESLSNLRAKFDEQARIRYYHLLAELEPTLVGVDDKVGLPDLFALKDRHVIQATLASNSGICLTLDRKHLLTDDARRWAMVHGFRLLTPGEFLEWRRLTSAG